MSEEEETVLVKMKTKKERGFIIAKSVSIIFFFFVLIYLLIFVSNLLSSSMRLMLPHSIIHAILHGDHNDSSTATINQDNFIKTKLTWNNRLLHNQNTTVDNQTTKVLLLKSDIMFPKDYEDSYDIKPPHKDSQLNATNLIEKNISIAEGRIFKQNVEIVDRIINKQNKTCERLVAHDHTYTIQELTTRLVIGEFITVLTQSSSVTSSIVVSLVASHAVSVRAAYPIIMGANIGTSMTSTLFSLSLYQEKHKIRRAFACATMHDIFNILTVSIVLPVEWISNKLGYGIATSIAELSFLEPECNTARNFTLSSSQCFTNPVKCLSLKIIQFNDYYDIVESGLSLKNCSDQTCQYLFDSWYNIGNDAGLGVLLFVLSILLLVAGIVTISQLAKKLLKKAIENKLKCRIQNSESRTGQYLKECLCIFTGMILTSLFQSSSAFTTLLIPLCVNQVICMKTTYCLILGGNLGTTSTALLSALAQDDDEVPHAFQIWFCHFFFNLIGILLFYPIPKMRWPLRISIILGEKVATYRWFGVLYLLTVFILLPGTFLALSNVPIAVFVVFSTIFVTILLFVLLVNQLQQFRNGWCLPPCLNTWNCLPLWMHSMKPWDNAIQKLCDKSCPNLSRFYKQRQAVDNNIELKTFKRESKIEDMEKRK